MVWLILIFSFLFEAAFSNLISLYNLFTPLFSLTAIVILYPYMSKNKISFILICMILGVLYDISFTGSSFVNTISFAIAGYILSSCYNYVKYNIYTANIINIIILISYRIINYIILLSINYINFNNRDFFSGIYNSLLINIIYCFILFFIVDLISKIFNKKR